MPCSVTTSSNTRGADSIDPDVVLLVAAEVGFKSGFVDEISAYPRRSSLTVAATAFHRETVY
jgi:hypothetical protein